MKISRALLKRKATHSEAPRASVSKDVANAMSIELNTSAGVNGASPTPPPGIPDNLNDNYFESLMSGNPPVKDKDEEVTTPASEPSPASTTQPATVEGGKGGEAGPESPPSPALQCPTGTPLAPDTNKAFLAGLFPTLVKGEHIAVCSKSGDPTSGGWPAETALEIDRQCPSTANNYFNCAAFRVEPDGGMRATKEQAGHYHVLILDDVGSKVPLTAVEGLDPTYVVETSPGNFQYGYALNPPISDRNAVDMLQQAVAAAGLCDKGALGIARWGRLPFAINGKAKYRDDDGNPFICRLTGWAPECRYSKDQIFAGFGLKAVSETPRSIAAPSKPMRPLPADLSHEVYRGALPENPVITALKEGGLYKREAGNGTHDITCPWVDEHTDQIDGGSAYFEPSPSFPTGGFKCQHSHGDKLSIGKLLERLEIDAPAARNRPEIRFVAGAIDQIVKASEYVLGQSDDMYQTGGSIVVLRRNLGSGDVRMELANEAELTIALSRAATFCSFDKSKECWRPTDPPVRVMQLLSKANRYQYLKPLNGIARHPYYRPADGTLVTTPGYDERSGIYGAFRADEVVLAEPTREAAETAMAMLEQLLVEFDFEKPTDKAAALSAMMTATVRPYLPVAPAFLTVAPESGVGKSYLNNVITAFAGGEPIRASFPATSEEATKSALSHLLTGPSCIEFDDMVGDFKPYPMLNRMLTSESVGDRVLGASKTATVSTRTFVIGSGINVAPERDMCRRVITIRLASRPVNRISRTFNGRPAEEVRQKRMAMVGAVLTIVESWKAAGSPKGDTRPIATYGDHWADNCRHPLIWLGQPDPAQSLFEQVEQDNDVEILATLLKEWHRALGDGFITVRHLLKKAHNLTGEGLADALDDLPVQDAKVINPSKLGWYFRKNARRIVDGYRLVEGTADGRKGWRVECVPPSPPLPEVVVAPDEPGIIF